MIFNNGNFESTDKFRGRTNLPKGFLLLLNLLIFIPFCAAQSNDQNFPTPVTSNTISGTIKARDIGDARLSNYFYTFNGTQGDIFVNVQTGNFNGDIDIFIADGLKSLTKIVIYADASDNETGRVIYLRKSEKLLLRIEGRSPNDDEATFNIKFAGSFLAVTDDEKSAAPDAPVVSSTNNSDVMVNSVGTIIGIKPKPPKEEPVKTQDEKKSETETAAENSEQKTVAETAAPKNKPKPKKEIRKTEKPSDDETNEQPKGKIEPKKEETASKKVPKKSNVKKDQPENTEETPKTETEKPAKEAKKTKTPKAAPTDEKANETAALANINLKIIFKDGTKIERPMSEVLKVGVDKTTLTVITKDGKIGRYSIFDVEKFTIE